MTCRLCLWYLQLGLDMPLKCSKTEESHEYLSFLVILQLLNQNQRWKCGYGAGIWTEIGERGITETSFSYEMKLWYHNGRAEAEEMISWQYPQTVEQCSACVDWSEKSINDRRRQGSNVHWYVVNLLECMCAHSPTGRGNLYPEVSPTCLAPGSWLCAGCYMCNIHKQFPSF